MHIINIKTFEINSSGYHYEFRNALQQAATQIEDIINEFLKSNNILENNILSLDIKHNFEQNSDDYEYCTMTGVLSYKD